MRIFLLTLLASTIPLSLFADGGGFEDFRLYKKPLLPGVEIAQTDTHTELFYRRVLIKTYVNSDFPTELYTHSPDDDPDCYNSLQNPSPSTRAKNIIGRDYLRSCLVLQTRMIKNRYILFYGPSTDGNRVSIYDIRTKKFAHAAVNNVLDVKTTLDLGLVFLTRNVGLECQKSIILYKNNLSRKIFDECSLQNRGIPLVRIDRYQIRPKDIIVSYTPYVTLTSGNIILDPTRSASYTLTY